MKKLLKLLAWFGREASRPAPAGNMPSHDGALVQRGRGWRG